MKKLLYILLFFASTASAQFTKDTIVKMKAYTSTFMNGNAYGIMTNGHYYNFSLVNHYLNNNPLTPDSIEVVRADLTSHITTSKKISHISSTSAIWINNFDSLGQFYVSFNSGGREIWKFNFKDSIYFENLGNGMVDGQALAYSSSLGTDNHMYFGGSSGPASTSWCEYDPYTKTLTTYPEINDQQGYVRNIAGDSTWVYAFLGQHTSELWAIRKSDSFKKKLFTIDGALLLDISATNNNRIHLKFFTDTLSGYFRLYNGEAITYDHEDSLSTRRTYTEVDVSGYSVPPYVYATYYDDVSSKFYYNISNTFYDSVAINADHTSNIVRRLYSFQTDTNNIYYTGDYYGVTYGYNKIEDSATALGSIGYNLYSTVAVNDSIMYFGTYPSGTLLKWNRNKKWTAQNPRIAAQSQNPFLIGTFRATPAGFHHAACMIQFNDSVLVAAGDVIRVGNTCSIASYDMKHNTWQGYDYNKISGLSASSILKWHDLVLFSTNNGWGGTPKIYFYNPQSNLMVDSMAWGLGNYGQLYLVGNTAIGVSPTMFYRIDLNKRIITDSTSITYNGYANHASIMLSDGRILVEETGTLPNWYKFVNINFGLFYSQIGGTLYGYGGYPVMKIAGVNPQLAYPINTPFQRYLMIKNKQ